MLILACIVLVLLVEGHLSTPINDYGPAQWHDIGCGRNAIWPSNFTNIDTRVNSHVEIPALTGIRKYRYSSLCKPKTLTQNK